MVNRKSSQTKTFSKKHDLHVLFIAFFCKMHNKEKLFTTVRSPWMVWDWCVLRAGSNHFYWPKLLIHFLCSPVFFSFDSLVLWGRDLPTDIVSITLHLPCIADFFLIIIIIREVWFDSGLADHVCILWS